MIKFLRTSKKGHILGLIVIAIAGLAAGCATRAETTGTGELPAPKSEAAATTQTPGMRMSHDPYAEREFD